MRAEYEAKSKALDSRLSKSIKKAAHHSEAVAEGSRRAAEGLPESSKRLDFAQSVVVDLKANAKSRHPNQFKSLEALKQLSRSDLDPVTVTAVDQWFQEDKAGVTVSQSLEKFKRKLDADSVPRTKVTGLCAKVSSAKTADDTISDPKIFATDIIANIKARTIFALIIVD